MKKLLFIILLCLVFPFGVSAFTLVWNVSPSAGVDGYRLYYTDTAFDNATRADGMIDVPGSNTTSLDINNCAFQDVDTSVLHFRMTAYDNQTVNGNVIIVESELSNEATTPYAVLTRPQPPQEVRSTDNATVFCFK